MGWGKVKSAISGNKGALIGTLLMPGVGTALGYGMDQQAKAQQEMDDAIAAQEGVVAREAARRRGNINEIRAQYGQTDASQTGDQMRKATVMGAKLAQDTRQTGEAAREQAIQANQGASSAGLTSANALAASTGGAGGSVHQRAKASVMGGMLAGQQNAASLASSTRASAVENLAKGQSQMEASAMGGAQDINPMLQAQQQAGAFRSAKQMVVPQVMGQMAQLGANSMSNYAQSSEWAGGNGGGGSSSGTKKTTGIFG